MNLTPSQIKFVLVLYGILIAAGNISCNSFGSQETLFTEMHPAETGVDFENKVTNTNGFNIYKYRNFYNGAGVALGDVNNDGLVDIYFTANQQPNRLFLNKGNFKFEDITSKASVEGRRAWSTGVSMVDINADGWLDIYVCNSGDVQGDNKQNEFFINNGDGTFTDKAAEMGLADRGYSIQSTFFDYDRDGDLDVFILNNSYRAIGSFDLRKNQRLVRDSLGGHKLYRNDNGSFHDVSEQAGIYGSEIGFGLGVGVADLDGDGWMDMYVCNDFFERDYIYMNNGNGTFREELERQMPSISGASMGLDIADIDEDGFPDIFVTEMLPKDERRIKTTMTFENWDKYQFNAANGYHHQFTRNMLHRNNGRTSSAGITFSEIGRFAGVEATDWSWSSLITDLNNDGLQDLFMTNGIGQDILDQDYLSYIANEEVQKMVIRKEGVDFGKLIEIIPATKISNYCFGGEGNFQFEDVTKKWGLSTPSFSNGAAYGDLDNDGDLDLVVNNVNMSAFLYRNNTDTAVNRFLKVDLKGTPSNTGAIGAQVTAFAGTRRFYLQENPVRGFQSSMDKRLNFGVGNIRRLDSLVVQWPMGKQTVLTNVLTNQMISISESEAHILPQKDSGARPSIFSAISFPDQFAHNENQFNDFDGDRMIYFMYSTQGPKLSIADVNGDGLEDFYMGGAKGQAGHLAIQKKDGTFLPASQEVFEKDRDAEDIGSAFFDADNDGDVDLYVTSGGIESSINSFSYANRLYLNDGRGKFIRSAQVLPTINPESTSTVKACDFDGDGDKDLFVGVRLRPWMIGMPQNGYLLINNGRGLFENRTKELCPQLTNTGMITDAAWADYDSDGDQDLFVVGEWMNIKVFNNNKGHFTERTEACNLAETNGWWNTIEAVDLDGDKDIDFVCGNHGLNSRFRASREHPVFCYVNDFDHNGSIEQITCAYNGDTSYPFALRHDLVAQIPALKKKYLRYGAYAGQTMNQMFEPSILAQSLVNKATMMETVVLINQGNGKFEIRTLPAEAQLAPVYAICTGDFDRDGITDIILGGNLYEVKPEVGRYDASYGTFLKGRGKGHYVSVPVRESGLFLQGQVRDIKKITVRNRPCLLIARNNATPQLFSIDSIGK